MKIDDPLAESPVCRCGGSGWSAYSIWSDREGTTTSYCPCILCNTAENTRWNNGEIEDRVEFEPRRKNTPAAPE